MNNEVINALLAPISTENPCGNSIRYDPAFDVLVAARREDDDTLPTGVWQTTPRRADWAEVEALASNLLQQRSKDLLIICWLGEAWIKQHGLAALPAALNLIAGAMTRYPDDLYPRIQDEDYDYRAAPLGWMASRYAELLADAPLFTAGGETHCLREWQQGRTIPLTPTPVDYSVLALTDSLEALQRINDACHCWPTDSAPSFLSLEQNLRTCQQVLGSPSPITVDAPSEKTPTNAPTVPLTFANREDAYQTLKHLADYLARVEPHSPVPYLLYRAHAWGYTPLPELLMELIGGDEPARRLWKQLGVLP